MFLLSTFVYFVGPGGMWAHVMPELIDRWMEKGDIPLLMSTSPAIPVTVNKRLPIRRIQYQGHKQNVFHWPNARIEVVHASFVDGCCSGDFCGGLELMPNGIQALKCCCFQPTQGDKGKPKCAWCG